MSIWVSTHSKICLCWLQVYTYCSSISMLPHNRRLSTSFIWWILICKSWFNLALNVDVITVGYLNLILMLFRWIAIDFIINIAPVLSKLIFFHLISFNLEKFHNFTSEYNYNCVFINIFVKKYNFIPMPPNGIMKKDAKSMYYCCLSFVQMCWINTL